MARARRSIVPVVLGFFVSAAVVAAQAPDGQPDPAAAAVQAETLYAGVPIYSVMKTEGVAIALTSTLTTAFQPLSVPCPSSAGSAGCTVRVIISSQFSGVSYGRAAQMNVVMSGPGLLGPGNLINVASGTDVGWASTHSMQWIKRNVPSGTSTTIAVDFKVSTGTGSAGYRTLTIDVLAGLI